MQDYKHIAQDCLAPHLCVHEPCRLKWLRMYVLLQDILPEFLGLVLSMQYAVSPAAFFLQQDFYRFSRHD